MVLYCEVCKVTVSSDVVMKDHVKGKKHLKNKDSYDRKMKHKEASIFTAGFPKGTTDAELRSHFSKFGSINRIIMDRQKGHFAIIEYDANTSASKALKEKKHTLKGSQLQVKIRENKSSDGKTDESTPSSGSSNDPRKASPAKRQPGIDHKELLKCISAGNTVLEQMNILHNTTKLGFTDYKQRKEICKILENVLSPFFYKCRVKQFGSSVNEFGVKGCDLDIYLDLFLDSKIETPPKKNPVKLPYVADIKSLTKTEGPLGALDIHQMALYDQVKLVSRILCEHAPGCNNIIAIPSSRCPVVRFVHEPTGVSCDVSINNRVALCNTKFLSLYGKLDERVKLLVFAIRHWAKQKDLVGGHSAGHKLSNYALTLLIVVYLQQVELLPTLDILQALCEPQEIQLIDGYKCYFCDDIKKFPPKNNDRAADELLAGFFQFYSEINFDTSVVVSKSATIMPTASFINNPHEDIGKLKISHLTVQDPFVLDHNITASVNENVKQKFVDELKIAAQKSSKWDVAAPWSPDSVGLVYLFSDEIPMGLDVSLTTRFESTHVKMDSAEGPYSFPLLLRSLQLPRDVLQVLSKQGDHREEWCRRVMASIPDILENVLLLKYKYRPGSITHEMLKVNDRKRQLPEADAQTRKKSRGEDGQPVIGSNSVATSSSDSQKTQSLDLLCYGYCRTWSGRKNINKDTLTNNSDGLEREKEISQRIVQRDGWSSKVLMGFECFLDPMHEGAETAVVVKCVPFDGAKEFACFFQYMKSFLTKVVEKNLPEVWKTQ